MNIALNRSSIEQLVCNRLGYRARWHVVSGTLVEGSALKRAFRLCQAEGYTRGLCWLARCGYFILLIYLQPVYDRVDTTISFILPMISGYFACLRSLL